VTEERREVLVRLGEVAVGNTGETLVALGLGSCVAVIAHDELVGVGGMAHVMLPSKSLGRGQDKPGRSADTAVPFLLQKMSELGASPRRTVGRLVGGASMFADLLAAGTVHIGERNIAACRAALRDAGVPVLAESVGGVSGRSVWFDLAEGVVHVRAVGSPPVRL